MSQKRQRTADGGLEVSPLISAGMLKEDLPTTEKAAATVAESLAAVEAVLDGKDDRLIVVVGPCSLHSPEAALDYANKLSALKRQHSQASPSRLPPKHAHRPSRACARRTWSWSCAPTSRSRARPSAGRG
jgi:hypothetical protein